MSDVTDAPRPAPANDSRSPAHGSHIWYELMTTDPEAAKRFYDSVVGWDIGLAHDDVGYRMIGRTDGGNAGGVLPLKPEMLEHGAKPMWMGYIGVDDVDATVTQVEEKGGRVLMPAWDVDTIGRIAMVADPEGNPFYLMKPAPPAGDEGKVSDVFSTEAEQRVGWNELTTADPAAARAFYGDVLGWTSDEFMPMGDLGEYRFFDHDGVRLGAACGMMPGGSAGWRYYIRVPSIDAAVQAVKAGGGGVSMGPLEVPGGDHIIIGHDPQGAEFALVGKQ